MRRNSRELAFKLIYESIFSSHLSEIDFSLRENDYIKYEKEEFDFAVEVYKKYFRHQTEILALLGENIQGYTLERVYKIDLALLALAVVEKKYFDIPLAVITNEVLELAKIYSTEKSPRFINGVISTIFGEDNV